MDAKRLSQRMILFSAVKLALSLFTFRFRTADMLLVTFSYAIVEMITVIPFTTNFFTAIDYSAIRLGVEEDSDKISSVKWYLYTFFAVKNLLAVIPSVVAFFDTESTGNLSASTWFIDFEAAMRVLMVLSFFISVIVSVASVIYLLPFFVRLIKNKSLNHAMISFRKETVLTRPEVMLKKNVSFVLTFFAAGIFFIFDFYLDSLDIFPTFVGFISIFVAAIYMKTRMNANANKLIFASGVGFVLTLSSFCYRLFWGFKTGFSLEYVFADKRFSLPLGISTSIVLAITIILMLKVLREFNNEYTRTKLEDSLFLLIVGGVIEAVFAFVLYSLPSLNTTFVFPSLVYQAIYISLSISYIAKLKKQISIDNR